jgi:hypothetical protein
MRHWKSVTAVIFMAMILATAASVAAQDTSPYLAGTWESGSYSDTIPYTKSIWVETGFEIVNPGTRTLDVYAVYYNSAGAYIPTTCRHVELPSNGVWRTAFPSKGLPEQYAAYGVGTVKFFAFPKPSHQFDPNTVIGGFERKYYSLTEWSVYVDTEFVALEWHTHSQANLKAVVINGSTIGEFGTIPWNDCLLVPLEQD